VLLKSNWNAQQQAWVAIESIIDVDYNGSGVKTYNYRDTTQSLPIRSKSMEGHAVGAV